MEQTETELLKEILANIHHPEALDGHPWAFSLFLKDMVARHGHLSSASRGRQLVAALSELFSNARPSTPPRRGKRLDTQWGEFGLLAALYFAPAQFGTPVPGSLRDAWGRIDQSILLYVNGHEPGENGLDSEHLLEMYGLVSPEPEVAPISTLSDWHRKGIEKLAEAVRTREKFLESRTAATFPAQSVPVSASGTVLSRRGSFRKAFLLGLTLLLLGLLGLGGYKAWRVYSLATVLRADLSELQAAAAAPRDLQTLMRSGPLLSRTRRDFAGLYDEVQPFLWLGPRLGWVPVYGGDLAASRELLEMAGLFLESADTAAAASGPVLALLDGGEGLNPPELVAALNEARPGLLQAQAALDEAMQLRAALDPGHLSPVLRPLIEEKLDPLLPLMDDALAVGTALPDILGGADSGPRTYLLLAQNEDELRPTGGFITAAGRLVVLNGQILNVSFVDSGELENWERPYPQAPWQLEEYMNSPVLVLRDTSWFPDFPTSALYAESLYAYKFSHSVDGVIAFDQHMLVMLLEALGPIEVEGAPEPVDSQNVIAYMRAAKAPPAGQPAPADWERKGFMDRIARAIILKTFEEQSIAWESLASTLLQGLDQHHLLLQLDEPTVAQVIARHGWDGALRYEAGDFLLVADANIGFNKTNAVVDTSLSYDVDLTDPAQPVSTLTVTHLNNASAAVPCIQWGGERVPGQEQYPVDACYWNYMRVYVPPGTELLDAAPQVVPDEWMILDRGVPGRVDALDEELDGLQGFGTLMVVPGQQAVMTSFEFGLPGHVLTQEGDRLTYRLQVKKQPGTVADPLIIRIHLPNGASLESPVPEAVIDGNHLYIETDLSTDLDVEVNFLLE